MTSPPALSVNCDNRKAMGKEIWHRNKIEKSTKNDNIELRKKKMTKWKSNFKSIKNYNVSSESGKNWKVMTIYLVIVTVRIEIIAKMIVMLLNKDNNK